MLRHSLWSIWLALFALLACKTDEFKCVDADDCDGQEALGRCEANGWCSFPDDTCPSLRRYGTHAGDGLASTCVPPEVGDDSSTGTDDSMSTTVTTVATVADDDATNADTAASFTQSDTAPDPVCGNGDAEQGEQCDGDDLEESCASLGHDGGELECNDDCTADESKCTDCGNRVLEAGELCDGPVAKGSCAEFGWFGGELTCADDCQSVDESGCTNCGNGVLDAGELCEGAELAQTCNELGFGDGNAVCTEECEIDTDECGPLVCGVDPEASLGPCPAICDSCDATTCVFDCVGNSACSDLEIACPPGWTCRVDCVGSSACSDVKVECPEFYGCLVGCSGSSACAGLDLSCSAAGTCLMSCDPESSSVCDNASVDCGGDACAAVCAGTTPELECGPTCLCMDCA